MRREFPGLNSSTRWRGYPFASLRMTNRIVIAGCAVAIPWVAAAQQYRGRLDVRGQAVSFRGLVSDSIDALRVVVGETGGL